MEFTQRQLDGLDPIVVYDPAFTKDEENNKVARESANEPMWLVGVMCTKPSSLPPTFVAMPHDPTVDYHTQTPKLVKGKHELAVAELPERLKGPAPAEEVLKEFQLRKEFELKQKQDQDAAFAEFKRTKEGK